MVLGIGRLLMGRVAVYDGLSGEFTSYQLDPDPHCSGCGSGERSLKSLLLAMDMRKDRGIDMGMDIFWSSSCGMPALDDPRQVSQGLREIQVTPEEVARQTRELVLIDVRSPEERCTQGMIDQRIGSHLGAHLGGSLG